MQDRIHKNVARLVVQSEKLGVLDRRGCRLLGAGNHNSCKPGGKILTLGFTGILTILAKLAKMA